MRNPGARQTAASRVWGKGHRGQGKKRVVERGERGGEESVAIKVMKCLLRAFKIKKKGLPDSGTYLFEPLSAANATTGLCWRMYRDRSRGEQVPVLWTLVCLWGRRTNSGASLQAMHKYRVKPPVLTWMKHIVFYGIKHDGIDFY